MKIKKENVLKLLLDLTIVFIGVLAAFWVSNYQSQKDIKEKRLKVYKNLESEISIFITGAKQIIPALDSINQEWDSKFAAGEMPDPYIVFIDGLDRPPNNVWKACMASGSITLMETDLMFSVSTYYSSYETVFRNTDAIIDFGRSRVIPFQGQAKKFYSSPRQLKPEYQDYKRRMDKLILTSGWLIEQAEDVYQKLQKEIGQENK